MFKGPDTYYDAVLARKFVKTAELSLTLVGRNVRFVLAIEDVEVVFTKCSAGEDIGDEFQE